MTLANAYNVADSISITGQTGVSLNAGNSLTAPQIALTANTNNISEAAGVTLAASTSLTVGLGNSSRHGDIDQCQQ